MAFASADAAVTVGFVLVLKEHVQSLSHANRAGQLDIDGLVDECLVLQN